LLVSCTSYDGSSDVLADLIACRFNRACITSVRITEALGLAVLDRFPLTSLATINFDFNIDKRLGASAKQSDH
jgi:hypothetical protein